MSSLSQVQRKRDRQTALTLVVVLAASVVIFLGSALLFSKLFTGHIASAEDYELFELDSQAYVATVDVTGTVEAAKTAVNAPDVTGTVAELDVEDGDVVEKGDVLFVIDSPNAESVYITAQSEYSVANEAADEARAVYEQAEAELEAAQASKELAEETLAAQIAALQAEAAESTESTEADETAEDGEAGESAEPEQEDAADESVDTQTDIDIELDASYDEAIAAAQEVLDEATGLLEEAESEESAALSAYESAKSTLASLTVTAPLAGTVCDMVVIEGENVSSLYSQGAALQIADTEDMSVVCSVPASDASSVMRSQDASVSGITASGSTVAATVVEVSDEVNGQTEEGEDCYDVTLELATLMNATMDMEVSVSIEVQDYGNVFYVPQSAVIEEDESYYIESVYDDGSTARHEVELLDTADDGQLIVRGTALADGATIRADLS